MASASRLVCAISTPLAMQNNLGPSRREFFAPEFLLVVLLAFGLFSVASVRALFGPLTGRAALLFDDHRVWTLLFYQLSVAPVIMYILWERGWKWPDFSVKITPRGVLQGMGLAAAAFAATKASFLLASSIAEASVPAVIAEIPATTGILPMMAMLGAAVVKAVFEEVLVCGYVVQSLRGRFGIALAANASIALRMSFHLYQGPAAFLGYAVFGLVFTLFYVRTGRLWPLIVAHALLAVVELAA
jgi:membrane protease YdiL (CAAX protease family)